MPCRSRRGAKGGGRSGPQAIMLDLQVDASGKISGNCDGDRKSPVLNIETGTIAGKTLRGHAAGESPGTSK